MELTDFIIEYKGKKLNNIMMTAWLDSIEGFSIENEISRVITIKVVYVDDDGIMKCIEDISNNFKLTPKMIDHE